MATLIQFRRDTAANWTTVNPVLAQGELGLETDTSNYKIGNGTTNWNSLIYYQLSPQIPALLFNTQPSNMTPPAANTMRIYAKELAGRVLPRYVGPSGLDSFLQPLMARNKIGYWCPPGNATTLPGIMGYTSPTIVGTTTARIITTTNQLTRMRRIGFVSAATAGSLASYRVAVAQISAGTGTGMGGFMKTMRFATSDAATVSGARMFVGISANTGAPTNVEPSKLTNSVGVGHGAADTNLKVYHGGSTAQAPIDLGPNFPANTLSSDVYEISLFSSPNTAGVISYEITRLNTGDVAVGDLTGTSGIQIPAATTLMTYAWAYRTNNTTALSVGLDIVSDYIETDS